MMWHAARVALDTRTAPGTWNCSFGKIVARLARKTSRPRLENQIHSNIIEHLLPKAVQQVLGIAQRDTDFPVCGGMSLTTAQGRS